MVPGCAINGAVLVLGLACDPPEALTERLPQTSHGVHADEQALILNPLAQPSV